MTNEQLEYVKSQLAAGVPPETIRTTLLQNGYNEALIEELFTATGVSAASTPATGFTPSTIQENPLASQTTQDNVSNQSYSTAPVGVGEFIGKSFSLAFSNIALFLPGFGILFILTLLAVFLSGGSPEDQLPAFVSIIELFIGILGVLFSFAYIYGSVNNQNFFSSIAAAAKKFLSFLFIGIITFLAIFSGVILFIVPGIIIATYLVFGLYVLAREDIRGYNALVRSTQLVYNNLGYIIVRLGLLSVTVIILGFLATIIAGILFFLAADTANPGLVALIMITLFEFLATMFSVMVSVSGLTILFNQLTAEKPTFDFESFKKFRTGYITASIAGIVLVPLTIFLLFFFLFRGLQSAETDFRGAAAAASLNNVRVQAELHFTMNSPPGYDGLCELPQTLSAFSSIERSPGHSIEICRAENESYIIVVATPENNYRCIDDTGFTGEISSLPQGVSCQ